MVAAPEGTQLSLAQIQQEKIKWPFVIHTVLVEIHTNRTNKQKDNVGVFERRRLNGCRQQVSCSKTQLSKIYVGLAS